MRQQVDYTRAARRETDQGARRLAALALLVLAAAAATRRIAAPSTRG